MKFILFGFVYFFSILTFATVNKCSLLFTEKTTPVFIRSTDPMKSSLIVLHFYEQAVQKGQVIRYGGQQYEILSWGLDKKGKTKVVLKTKATGEIKEIQVDQTNERAWQSKVVTLENVLKFEDENIVRRIMRDHPEYSESQARELFYEMKKWFFVKARAETEKSDVTPYMYNEIDMIDHSWHAFLLFTVSYRNFGMTYFGKFLEHTPSLLDDPEVQRLKFYEFVKETLGEETYYNWFILRKYDPHKSTGSKE